MRKLGLIMNADGTPARLRLAARESEAGGGRVKAQLAAEVGRGTYVVLPNGKRVDLGVLEEGAAILGNEFRIELMA